MTKAEMFKQAMAICEKFNASEELKTELASLLEPKKGGKTVNIEDIVHRDEDGNIVELQCRASGVWLPANLEYFTGDKNSKIVNAEGEKLYTISRQAQKLKSDAKKAYKASKDAITDDVLNGVIAPEDAKAALAELSDEPDYSSVSV